MTTFSAERSQPPIQLEQARLEIAEPILEIHNLNKSYGSVRALEDVSLELYPREVLGVVGESGSGKSTLLRVLNLEEQPEGGEYRLGISPYEGRNLLQLERFERRALRVKHIGIVYQNPHLGLRMNNTSSGNVAERLVIAGERRFHALRAAARGSLEVSEFPISRMDDPPRKLSGGMQQRVQLAKAIALKPALLLLDEPTTGLDVSVQALVLDTLRRLQRDLGITMLVVSHDLGVIRTLADRVVVMRHGRVVESGLTDQVLEDPQHPYTQQLVHAKL